MSNPNVETPPDEIIPMPFAQEVWEVLSDTDVMIHAKQLEATKGRPAISYLPWHKTWLLLKRAYPASQYAHQPDLIHHGGTVEVQVDLRIQAELEGAFVLSMARLPVMDFRYNAIIEPNARELNDARQRCLVKACAFAGLGLNLWSESPLPVGKLDEPITTKQFSTLTALIEKSGTDEELFAEWCECDLSELPQERYVSAKALLEAKIRSKK